MAGAAAADSLVGCIQDLQLVAEKCILRGLKEAGIVAGDVQEMVDQRIGALFMPHGGQAHRCLERVVFGV